MRSTAVLGAGRLLACAVAAGKRQGVWGGTLPSERSRWRAARLSRLVRASPSGGL